MRVDSNKQQEKKYGLRLKKTGQLLGVSTTSNEGSDFCGDVSHWLEAPGKYTSYDTWLVDDLLRAEYVRNFSTPWYNAGYATPGHDFEADELEVVSIEVSVNVESENISIPSVYELYRKLYENEDPGHWGYVKKEIESGHLSDYDWWRLMEYTERYGVKDER